MGCRVFCPRADILKKDVWNVITEQKPEPL